MQRRIRVGASGWSYATWRPGFYPAGTDQREFLGYYAQRFDTVELNTTGYRLPPEDQFRRWAETTPEGFEFAPKLPGHRPGLVGTFAERVRALGDRLGPVRVALKSARDEGMLELLLGSLDPSLRLAFDLQPLVGRGRGPPRRGGRRPSRRSREPGLVPLRPHARAAVLGRRPV